MVKSETFKMPKLELFRIIPETISWTQLQLQLLWSQFQITPETTNMVARIFASQKIREKLAHLHENPTAQRTAETLILTESLRLIIQKLF